MNTLDIIKAQVAESIQVKQGLLSNEAVMAKVAVVADVLVKAYQAGHKTLWAGNGGSAADAQHMAGELVNKFTFDRPGLPALSLSTDTSIITAVGNDYGFDRLFARQVEAQGCPGDVFIGIHRYLHFGALQEHRRSAESLSGKRHYLRCHRRGGPLSAG